MRVSFASNDERTAKRISDALGTATEMRAMKNYAGHRLSPWLGHLMVSRTETSRPLLTPGEVMQLPSHEEIVLVGGISPIRGSKARYYEDRRLMERVLPPPTPAPPDPSRKPTDDWTGLPPIPAPPPRRAQAGKAEPALAPDQPDGQADDPANAGIRREPELPEHEEIAPKPQPAPGREFDFDEPGLDQEQTARNQRLQERLAGTSRQASLDPDDGLGL